MIPTRLTLRNFMSYGDEPTTLPFEGLHVACLSGDNGNGKSALLDAITWSLWDKTRASSVQGVSADDIIRLGADEVEVRFEFDLNERSYRVVRKRRRGKSSPSDWQLTQKNSEGAFVPVGGGSQRETGKQIVKLLSMEYETFLNSAYLQQGRADEFTRQKPTERKRILGEILGLEKFERLEAMAREKWKERADSLKELEFELNTLQGRVADRAGFEERLEETCTELAEAEGRVAEQEKATNAWRDRRSKLEAVAQQATDAEAVCLRLQTDLQKREQELAVKQERLRKMQELLGQREAILGDYQRLQEARQRREKLDPEIAVFNTKSQELLGVQGDIDREKVRLEGELKLQERMLREVERRKEEADRLQAQRADWEPQLQQEAEVAQRLEATQVELQAAQDAFTDLKGKNDALKQSIDETDEVLEMLAHPHAACPVCESDLSGKKREAVLQRQQAKRDGFMQELDGLKRQGGQAKQRVTQAQETLNQLTAQMTQLTRIKTQAQQAEERRAQLVAEGINVASVRKETELKRQQLETEDYAAPRRARRQQLQRELELLGMKKAEYEGVMQTIRRLEETERRYHQLQQMEATWTQEMAERDRLTEARQETQRHAAEAQAKYRALQEKLGQFAAIQEETLRAEQALKALQNEQNQLLAQKGSLERYIADCDRAAQAYQTRLKDFNKLDEEKKVYQALAQAFGKKGVQAQIIENALPELEDETNALLARITDNALQIRFETTRQARSNASNEIETLDIKVMDDAGSRPYELFSGGEGFRVNFAIRIALSRLLARRSGARLQTLILDEGFGSQDGKGREKLVEVIESIKDDFEKILVITHFEEMKDSFSQRIEIIKEAGGSRIHLL